MLLSPKDKLTRASQTLIESVKDTTVTTLVQAVNDGKLKLELHQQSYLHNLVKQAIETGYNRAFNGFSREVDSALEEVRKK